MKRIVIAVLAAVATTSLVVANRQEYREERACKRTCGRDRICRNSCERRSVPRNFAHGVSNIVRGGVQTGSAGLIPATEQGMDEAREGRYNPIRNIGTGVRDTAEGVVQTGTLGLAGRDWDNE